MVSSNPLILVPLMSQTKQLIKLADAYTLASQALTREEAQKALKRAKKATKKLNKIHPQVELLNHLYQ